MQDFSLICDATVCEYNDSGACTREDGFAVSFVLLNEEGRCKNFNKKEQEDV